MLTRSQILSILRDVDEGRLAMHSLRAEDFEAITAFLLESLNCRVEKWGRSHHLDVDFLITVPVHVGDVDGVVECKRRPPDREIDVDTLRAFHQTIGRHSGDIGIFVTTSRFTKKAVHFCEQIQPRIDLIDVEALRSWVRTTLEKEKTRISRLALQIEELVLKEMQHLQGGDIPRIITPEYLRTLILPEDYHNRVLITGGVPFHLVQEVARDPRHMNAFTPRQFEEFVAEILDAMKFEDIILTPEKGDGGRDVIATKIFSDIPITCYFECKKYAKGNKVQLQTLRALLGTVAHEATRANIGVLVTTSTFTKGCRELIVSEARLDGKDYAGILGWLEEYKRLYPIGG